VAFTQFHYKHSASLRRNHIIWGILIPAGIFVWSCIDGFNKGRWDSPVIGAAIGGALMLWLLGGQRGRLEKAARKMLSEGSNKVLLGAHELETTETGLISRSEYEEGRLTWDVIERIGFTPDYTFVFIGAAQGITVAKSSVLEGDYEEFGEELRRRFEEKVRAANIQQKRDFGKRVITDTRKVYKEDTGFGKHSRRGIASFVIAMAAGVLYLSVLGLMFILAGIAPELTQGRSEMLHIFTAMVMVGFFGNIVGVVLGIGGVCQKNQKKLFAVLGLVFNSIAVIGFGILIAIPKVIS
jgi:hypothetical protein